ncbi:helicase [Seminavis robusta]|uniref:Helicase n=1 Tax=Seminavis robusta TaxID=568900 RepID=A0A9N8H0Z8_9STRA|nr:helicase [Seminavis robusta]|eukprot:Sro8_g006870.1 helicase (701) ;mRNA; f:221180-224210
MSAAMNMNMNMNMNNSSINMNVDSASSEEGHKKLTPQGRWEEMYQRLDKYQQKHGDCLVPNRYEEDPQLGAWVSTQRRHYKLIEAGEASPMTPHRIDLLEKIGFKWSAKCPRHIQWESRFQALLRFKDKFGHTQVPINWEEDVQLANWVSTQRQEYQNLIKGRTTRLDERRIRLLNGVGFSWQLQRGGRKRHLQEVKQPGQKDLLMIAQARTAASTATPTGTGRPPRPTTAPTTPKVQKQEVARTVTGWEGRHRMQPGKVAPAKTNCGTATAHAPGTLNQGLAIGAASNKVPPTGVATTVANDQSGALAAQQTLHNRRLTVAESTGASAATRQSQNALESMVFGHSKDLGSSVRAQMANNSGLDGRPSLATAAPAGAFGVPPSPTTGLLSSSASQQPMVSAGARQALLINRLSQNSGLSSSVLGLLGVDHAPGRMPGQSALASASSLPPLAAGWQGTAAGQAAIRNSTAGHASAATLAALGYSVPGGQASQQVQIPGHTKSLQSERSFLEARARARLLVANASTFPMPQSHAKPSDLENGFLDAHSRARLLAANPAATRGLLQDQTTPASIATVANLESLTANNSATGGLPFSTGATKRGMPLLQDQSTATQTSITTASLDASFLDAPTQLTLLSAGLCSGQHPRSGIFPGRLNSTTNTTGIDGSSGAEQQQETARGYQYLNLTHRLPAEYEQPRKRPKL